jgi:hypothetical protein
VAVEPADDPDEEPSLVAEHWPGALIGSLLLTRSGVTVRAGRHRLDPEVAARSCLYWGWYRRNRIVRDLSHGWGQNSQWRTDFRRDYVTPEALYYNVDAHGDRPVRPTTTRTSPAPTVRTWSGSATAGSATSAPSGGPTTTAWSSPGSDSFPGVTMLREVEANYAPEFSTLMVRDVFVPGMVDPPPPPRDYPEDAQPCGTMGRSGAGFLDAPASGEDQTVRLQLHDGLPPDDRADWTSVLRTPYWSRSGSVSLEFVTGGAVSPALDLGGPGRYGVCVARRGESPEVEWRLRFWSDSSSTVDLPRWLVRPGPATRPPSDGWEDLLGWPAQELVGIVRSMSRSAAAPG